MWQTRTEEFARRCSRRLRCGNRVGLWSSQTQVYACHDFLASPSLNPYSREVCLLLVEKELRAKAMWSLPSFHETVTFQYGILDAGLQLFPCQDHVVCSPYHLNPGRISLTSARSFLSCTVVNESPWVSCLVGKKFRIDGTAAQFLMSQVAYEGNYHLFA